MKKFTIIDLLKMDEFEFRNVISRIFQENANAFNMNRIDYMEMVLNNMSEKIWTFDENDFNDRRAFLRIYNYLLKEKQNALNYYAERRG